MSERQSWWRAAARRAWQSLWRSRSLTLRVTVVFALIVSLVVGTLGTYLYSAASMALAARSDLTLVGRVEHFRTLLHDLYNVKQIEARPTLFETMLGNEQDVMVFRKPGAAPFIQVNPAHMALPTLPAVPVGRPVTLDALRPGSRPDGIRVRWVAAQAEVGQHGGVVEIVAAHVMTQEAQLLRLYFERVLLAVICAVLTTALLGYVVLSKGLRPLRSMADKAAEITPKHLSARLEESDAPPELRRLAASFNAMLDRLAEGYERLSQFSADLAHEVRTPIGVLIGQTQVTLAKLRSNDEYQSVLESNLEELERLSRMAENILFLAHADHAALVIERSTLNLRDELGTIRDYFEGLGEERRLSFEVDAEGMVQASPMLCRRAISNLVVNAVRYATPGTTIRLSGRAHARGATISIENHGAPLRDEQLARLFHRFYRGDSARSQFTESNGLGLAIVQAIMGLHGGTAAVSCTPQGLVRFTLDFPPAHDMPRPAPPLGA